MKAMLCALAAAGLLAAASAHAATPGEIQHIMVSARAAADARLVKAGVVLGDKTIAVEMTVLPMGGLGRVQVLRSSGSPEADAAVARALNGLRLADLPTDLLGAHLTLVIGRPEIVEAKAW